MFKVEASFDDFDLYTDAVKNELVASGAYDLKIAKVAGK